MPTIVKIFISYRREDSAAESARLADRLTDAFGHHAVFFDRSAIGPGDAFEGNMMGGTFTADAILIVIGPEWLRVADDRGKRRLDNKNDPVRSEVAMALTFRRPTVPLLVRGASMPTKRDLPRDIRNFASLSAVALDDHGFDQTVDQLIAQLGGPQPDPMATSTASRRPRRDVAWSSVEGLWQGSDGSMSELLQDGDTIEINGRAANGIEFHGRGTRSGSQIVLDCANGAGAQFRVQFSLTPDGAYLNGQMSDGMNLMPINMMRRG